MILDLIASIGFAVSAAYIWFIIFVEYGSDTWKEYSILLKSPLRPGNKAFDILGISVGIGVLCVFIKKLITNKNKQKPGDDISIYLKIQMYSLLLFVFGSFIYLITAVASEASATS